MLIGRTEGAPSELQSMHRGQKESDVCVEQLRSPPTLPWCISSQQGWEHRALLPSCSNSSEKWSEQESQKTAASSWRASERRERQLCFSAALMAEPGATRAVGTLLEKHLDSAADRAGAAVGVLGGRHSHSYFLVQASQLAKCQRICRPSRRIFMGTCFYFSFLVGLRRWMKALVEVLLGVLHS